LTDGSSDVLGALMSIGIASGKATESTIRVTRAIDSITTQTHPVQAML